MDVLRAQLDKTTEMVRHLQERERQCLLQWVLFCIYILIEFIENDFCLLQSSELYWFFDSVPGTNQYWAPRVKFLSLGSSGESLTGFKLTPDRQSPYLIVYHCTTAAVIVYADWIISKYLRFYKNNFVCTCHVVA